MGQATRVNSMGVPRKMPNGLMQWTRSSSRKGIADVIGSYRGRFIAIEVKIGKDKQGEAQRQEQARIEATSGLYFIAKDFPSFLDWWQEQGFEVPELLNSKHSLKQ